MFFRDLKSKSDVVQDIVPAHVFLPVLLGVRDAERAFAEPLGRQLAAAGLGHVTECRPRVRVTDEAQGIDIFLALTAVGAGDLMTLTRMLEHLDAPRGSWLRLVDGGTPLRFGRASGLGLYLDDRKGAIDDAGQSRLATACASATEDFRGAARVGDKVALYFYGDSFEEMKTELARRLRTHPRLKTAVARRLI